MSALRLEAPRSATLPGVSSPPTSGGCGAISSFFRPIIWQTRHTPRRGHSSKKKLPTYNALRNISSQSKEWCSQELYTYCVFSSQDRASGARSKIWPGRGPRASAAGGSEAKSGPEDELTLGERLNAISHRRPLPGVNGSPTSSMRFGGPPPAGSHDPSLSNQRNRGFADPVRPPVVVRASNRIDVVGVLGGISPRATADFMRQVIQATPATSNKDHVPLVISSIPQIPSLSAPILNRPVGPGLDEGVVSPLPAMLETRRFLEQSGARCIVMPSNMAHFWYDQLALDCSVPFLHIADAVVEELDLANLEPLEAGSRPKIGLLASEATLKASIYQQKLEARGYTVVLPDRDTMAHAVLPGMEAVERGDNEGAKNLLGIGIQVLLVNAVNVVILAFSEASSVFPSSDPILKRCLSPTAALARATVRWVIKTRAESEPTT